MPRSFFGEGEEEELPGIEVPNMAQAVVPPRQQQQAQQPSLGLDGLFRFAAHARDQRERSEDREFSRSLTLEDQEMQRQRFAMGLEDRERGIAVQEEELGRARERHALGMRNAEDQERELELGRQRDEARARIQGVRTRLETEPLANERQLRDAASIALAEDAKSGRWGENFEKMNSVFQEVSGDRYRKTLEEITGDLQMLPTGEAEEIRRTLDYVATSQGDSFSKLYGESLKRMQAGLDVSKGLREDAASRADHPNKMLSIQDEAQRLQMEGPRGFAARAANGTLGAVPQLVYTGMSEDERTSLLAKDEFGDWSREFSTRLDGESAAQLALGNYEEAYRKTELGNDFKVQPSDMFLQDDFANILIHPSATFSVKGSSGSEYEKRRGRKIPLDKGGKYFAIASSNDVSAYDDLYERVGRFHLASSSDRPGPAELKNRVRASFFGGEQKLENLESGNVGERNYADDLEALQRFWSQSTLSIVDKDGVIVQTIADPMGGGRESMNATLERLGLLQTVPGSTRGVMIPDARGEMRVQKPLGYTEWRNRVDPIAKSLRQSAMAPLQKGIESALSEIPGVDTALNLDKSKGLWMGALSSMLLDPRAGGSSWLQMKLAEGASMPEAMAAFEEQMLRPAVMNWTERSAPRAKAVATSWETLRKNPIGQNALTYNAATQAYRDMDRAVIAPQIAQMKMKFETSNHAGKIPWRDSRGAPGNVSSVEFGGDSTAQREWNRWGTAMPDWWDQRFAGDSAMLDLAHTYARIRTHIHANGTGEDSIYQSFSELGKPGAFTDQARTTYQKHFMDMRRNALKSYAARNRNTIEDDPILIGMARFLNVQ